MKKRICSLLLALALACSLLPGAALAVDQDRTAYQEGGLIYNLDTGMVIGPVNKNGITNVRIADTVDNVQIWQIAPNAFSGCPKLAAVTIPTSVREIGMSAFENCPQLKTVAFRIGKYGFGSSLYIRPRAFADCKLLSNVELPKTMPSIYIESEAFAGCTGLKTIDLPEGVFSLGDRAFATSGLTGVTLPSSLGTLGESAFESCTGLEKIVILEGGCPIISKKAFAGCTNKKLTTVSLPATVSEIGESAFEGCTALSSVSLPGAVTVPGGTPYGGVTKIGPRAFAFCENLETMCLPASLTAIGDNAFSACAKLKILHYGGDDPDALPNKDTAASGKEVHCTLTSSITTRVASCNLEGISTDKISCETCGKIVRTEERPTRRLLHLQQLVASTPATCTRSGLTDGFVCTVCNEVLQAQEVIPASGHQETKTDGDITKPATCGEDGEQEVIVSCATCGNELRRETKVIPALTGEHSAGSAEIVRDPEPTCSEPGKEFSITKCTKCGQEMSRVESEIPPTGNHTSSADKTETVVRKEPQCDAPGFSITVPVCTVCEKPIIDSAIENKDAADFTDEEKERYQLKELTVPHTFDEKEEPEEVPDGPAEEPTCTEAGFKTVRRTCTVCKQAVDEKEEVPALGHLFGAGTEYVTKEPTCTEKGVKALGYAECQREGCDETRQSGEEEIPALGHERTETVKDEDESRDATCTEPGLEVIKATVCARDGCGEEIPEERKVLPALGHTPAQEPTEGTAKEPTCTEPGSKNISVLCTRCNQIFRSEEFPIPAKGHSFGEWTVTKAATATEAGSRERTCSACGEKETEAIPATGGATTPEDPKDPENPKDPDDKRDYDIDVIYSANGAVDVTGRAAPGDTVTIRVRPDSGYELDELTVTRWDNDRELRLSGGGSNRFTFTMPATHVEIRAYFSRISSYYSGWRPSSSGYYPSSTVSTTPASQTSVILPAPRASGYAAGFTDVPASHWAAGEIGWASQNGYMGGVGGGRFNPGGSISYQQLWMVLARFMGAYPADMEAARLWAVEKGFAEGANPTSSVTRQQMVVALYRTARLSGSLNGNTASLTNYTDSRLVAASARNAMSWAVANGIISGNADGCLNPNGTVTRDQFAVILYRFTQRR